MQFTLPPNVVSLRNKSQAHSRNREVLRLSGRRKKKHLARHSVQIYVLIIIVDTKQLKTYHVRQIDQFYQGCGAGTQISGSSSNI